jgi:hypothetical protein
LISLDQRGNTKIKNTISSFLPVLKKENDTSTVQQKASFSQIFNNDGISKSEKKAPLETLLLSKNCTLFCYVVVPTTNK